MIRGKTETGSEYIGLTRAQWARLQAGERVCLPSHRDAQGFHYRHMCLFIGEDNADLVKRAQTFFPDGFLPGAPIEHVSREEP